MLLLLLVEPTWAYEGSPETGLCMAEEKGPFVIKYDSVKPHSASASLCTAARKERETQRKMKERKKKKQGEKGEIW